MYDNYVNKSIENSLKELHELNPSECESILAQIHEKTDCVIDANTLNFIENGSIENRMQLSGILINILADKRAADVAA